MALWASCFFLGGGGDRKNKMAARHPICWDIFDFSSETPERNLAKLDKRQDLNVLCQICVFGSIRKTRLPSWPIRQKVGTLYSGAIYVALWVSCFNIRSWKRWGGSPNVGKFNLFWKLFRPKGEGCTRLHLNRMASHCGQKSVFSKIRNSFCSIRKSFLNSRNSFLISKIRTFSNIS